VLNHRKTPGACWARCGAIRPFDARYRTGRDDAERGSEVATDTLTASEVDLDRLAVDTVRVLAMDAIQKASNGHPGTAMALAPAA
jgi:Transketolase, thiamine diphosphate binding domain